MALLAVSAALLIPAPAWATGPVNWQFGFQDAASPVAERLNSFHAMLLYIISAITLFVFGLLAVIFVRFNAKANPKPATFTHNTMIEIIWTVIPVIILIVIAVPSMQILYYTDRSAHPDMTLKVTGNQWYWSYEYPDQGGISFSSYMIPENEIDAGAGQKRLLSTDHPVVLPVDTDIQVLVTASDVLHAFAVPALGVKMDGVPGRINETWMRITKPGTYYGQCSELCGKGHGYMPIEIVAVSKDDFSAWAAKQGGGAKEQAPAQDEAKPEEKPAGTEGVE